MSKKILTALLPVVALIAFALVPAMAQATQIQAPEGTELANSSTVLGQSGNLVVTTSLQPPGEEEPTITCTGIEFEGKVTKNQGELVEGTVTKDVLTSCTGAGFPTHIVSNASAEKPWTLQAQAPDEEGKFTVHLDAAPGGVIQFTSQLQFFGSVASCDYSMPSLQLSGEEGSDELTVEGTNQFTKQSGGELCGQHGTLSGKIQLESGGNDVTFDA